RRANDVLPTNHNIRKIRHRGIGVILVTNYCYLTGTTPKNAVNHPKPELARIFREFLSSILNVVLNISDNDKLPLANEVLRILFLNLARPSLWSCICRDIKFFV